MNMLPEETVNTATKHIHDILSLAIMHKPEEQAALVVSDANSVLSVALTKAYQRALPSATFVDFNSVSHAEIFALFQQLSAHDLVVLIQSSSFRLQDFRIRVELFERSLKVIEHPHLERMTGIEATYYIDSLAYDPDYFRTVGHALKNKIDHAQSAIVDSDGEQLVFGSLEEAKLNIGDYTHMKNVGGQFPIGEVFTEAKDLESVNGRVRLYAFADTQFTVNKPEIPITLVVTKGRITDVLNATPEFEQVLANIRADENEVWLRELGFGMNRAFTPNRIVSDVGTYERMCGIHLSIGAKHAVYKKNNFKRGTTWHHVDVFAITKCVYLEDDLVFENGNWRI